MEHSNKYFIITVDTEGDNLWAWKEGTPLETKNAKYLSRFQKVCEKYGFIPTWLCNWEMVNDPDFISFANEALRDGKCGIGMHLHAWNTPPYYELPRSSQSGLSYLTEYPEDIIRAKIETMTNIIMDKLGKRPVVHRAGRWGMNNTYFKALYDYEYIAACSVTPYVNWRASVGQTPGYAGPDYSMEKPVVSTREGILEIPVTTLWSEKEKRAFWLRPNRGNLEEMLYLIAEYTSCGCDYLMFMIHSSELMAGGSPTFQTEGGIEILYEHLEIIFNEIAKNYTGIGLEEYAYKIRG